MPNKGTLFLIGGGEDKVGSPPDIMEYTSEFTRYELLRELIPHAKERTIELITSASKIQESIKNTYQKVFNKLGYEKIDFIPIAERSEANSTTYLKRVQEAGVIFFTGGNQFRLSTILGGTSLIDMIKERYKADSDFLVAGTSAGAMVMSSVMMKAGGRTEALIYNNLHTSSGFGLVPNYIIDTHFIKRGRFGRLAHAIIMNPEQLGLGLGEDTGLMIKPGNKAECLGSGMTVVIDGRQIGQTNIREAEEGEAIYVENLKVHLLVKGCQFLMDEVKFP
ncbi:cyanophycinase [Legionella lytica]|uniref:Cyanophycinase n=1 Tax=Legionella lytica TaxID=96232 RepID=A0ABW8DEF8_9GAMM